METSADAVPGRDLQQQRRDLAAERPETGGQLPAEPLEMPLPQEAETIFQGIVCVIAVLACLYIAQAIVLPVVLVIVLKLLLQPLVNVLERLRVPKPVGALIALAVLLLVFVGLGIGRWIYVTSDGSSTLSVIDTTADRVERAIEVGRVPNGVALTPDGKLLLVAVFGDDRIAFLDTGTQAIVGTVAVPKPHTIAIRPDGKVAYVTSQEPGHFALAVVDLASRTLVRTMALDKPPRDAEFGYDGRALYFTQAGVSAVQVLDPASDKIIGEIPTGVSPHYVKFLPWNERRYGRRAGAGGASLIRSGDEQAAAQHWGGQTA
jgi:YVTN family beta-propeller protein